MRLEFELLDRQDQVIARGVEAQEPGALCTRLLETGEAGRPHVLRYRELNSQGQPATGWVRRPLQPEEPPTP